MTVERIHPKASVMLIFIAVFTCLPSCINLSNNKHSKYLCQLVLRSFYPSVNALQIQKLFLKMVVNFTPKIRLLSNEFAVSMRGEQGL